MDHKSLKARVFDGQGWNKAYVEGALIHDLWAEVDRLRGFAEHKRHCNAWPYKLILDGFEPDPNDCTCGLMKPDSATEPQRG